MAKYYLLRGFFKTASAVLKPPKG